MAVLVEIQHELAVRLERPARPLYRPALPDGLAVELIGDDVDRRARHVDRLFCDDVDVVQLRRERVHRRLDHLGGVDGEDPDLYLVAAVDRRRGFVARADDVRQDAPHERREGEQRRRAGDDEFEC